MPLVFGYVYASYLSSRCDISCDHGFDTESCSALQFHLYYLLLPSYFNALTAVSNTIESAYSMSFYQLDFCHGSGMVCC